MRDEVRRRVLLSYVRQGYAPSKIDKILDLPKGETKRVLMRMWRAGLKV